MNCLLFYIAFLFVEGIVSGRAETFESVSLTTLSSPKAREHVPKHAHQSLLKHSPGLIVSPVTKTGPQKAHMTVPSVEGMIKNADYLLDAVDELEKQGQKLAGLKRDMVMQALNTADYEQEIDVIESELAAQEQELLRLAQECAALEATRTEGQKKDVDSSSSETEPKETGVSPKKMQIELKRAEMSAIKVKMELQRKEMADKKLELALLSELQASFKKESALRLGRIEKTMHGLSPALEEFKMLKGAVKEGSFGVIVKATHSQSKIPVVFKGFKALGDAYDERDVESFLAELRIYLTLTLNSKTRGYVVPFLGILSGAEIHYIDDDGKQVQVATRLPFLVFKKYAQDLRDFIEQYMPYNAMARDMFRVLLEGDVAIKEAGVLHLDIKPENLVVESKSSDVVDIRFIDFGIAQFMKAIKESSCRQVVTVTYRAPELFFELSSLYPITDKVDIYAIGRMLIETWKIEGFDGTNMKLRAFLYVYCFIPYESDEMYFIDERVKQYGLTHWLPTAEDLPGIEDEQVRYPVYVAAQQAIIDHLDSLIGTFDQESVEQRVAVYNQACPDDPITGYDDLFQSYHDASAQEHGLLAHAYSLGRIEEEQWQVYLALTRTNPNLRASSAEALKMEWFSQSDF